MPRLSRQPEGGDERPGEKSVKNLAREIWAKYYASDASDDSTDSERIKRMQMSEKTSRVKILLDHIGNLIEYQFSVCINHPKTGGCYVVAYPRSNLGIDGFTIGLGDTGYDALGNAISKLMEKTIEEIRIESSDH